MVVFGAMAVMSGGGTVERCRPKAKTRNCYTHCYTAILSYAFLPLDGRAVLSQEVVSVEVGVASLPWCAVSRAAAQTRRTVPQ